MKTKILWLMIFCSLNSFSESIIKKVYTDKTIYNYGETVTITIRAINSSLVQSELIFPNSCDAYPYVDSVDYLTTFGLGCYATISVRVIPPRDSIEWIYTYPPYSLSIGQHSVFGNFRLWDNKFTELKISNTDTLYFLIVEPLNVKNNGNNLGLYLLEQNYPNPFNSTTSINYVLPSKSLVILKVFNILGDEMATLVNEEKEVGYHKVNFDASNVTSGVYYYKLQVGNFISIKKMVLIK